MMPRKTPAFNLATLVLALLVATMGSSTEPQTPEKYAKAIARLEEIAQQELDRSILSGFSIALIDDDSIVYARGFGLADKARQTPATAKSIYRAGSISKLFTAVAAMQLAEQGQLDIDAPLEKYNPAFRISNPFSEASPITLRQLMSHRSGMIREAPRGGYFDDQQPTLEETLASVAGCVLVNPPNTKTRYSNVGPSIVGQTAALVASEKFESLVQRKIFDVVDMPSSSWLTNAEQRSRRAAGYMRVAQSDGSFTTREAPHFELGTIPAGNLYTTVEDLGRFASFLLGGGRRGERTLVKSETLEEMFRPQLTSDATGFGLGFLVTKWREHKTVQHMGAVYGFTSSLVVLPEAKVAAVVLSNEDIAIGPVQRLMDASLEAVLAGQSGMLPSVSTAKEPFAKDDLERFVGEFESESYWAEITQREGKLQANVSGQPIMLDRQEELAFQANGRIVHESPVVFMKDEQGNISAFTLLRQTFHRVDRKRVKAIPAEWEVMLGSYGPAFIPLIVSERNGHLYAMTENEFDYRLTPLNRTVFRMPPGLYTDEQLVFQFDAAGTTVHSVILANMTLKRHEHKE